MHISVNCQYLIFTRINIINHVLWKTFYFWRTDFCGFHGSIFPSWTFHSYVAPAYAVYISQLIRYSRACGSHQDFLDRGLLLTMKLLNQGFLLFKLRSSVRKFYGRHHNLVECYGIAVSQMTRDMFLLS